MTKDPLIYLEHILAQIKDIISFTRGQSLDEFLNSRITQAATIRCFEVIGEATKNLPAVFKDKYPDVEWKKMAGMRDKLIHDHIDVDLWAVWNVVEQILPPLEIRLKEIMAIEKGKD